MLLDDAPGHGRPGGRGAAPSCCARSAPTPTRTCPVADARREPRATDAMRLRLPARGCCASRRPTSPRRPAEPPARRSRPRWRTWRVPRWRRRWRWPGPTCDDHGRGVRLAVIGMGKCGGRELNYVSDVDVIYVAEPVDGVDEAEALAVGDAARRGPGAGVLDAVGRAGAVAGRRRAAARGQGRAAGADAREPQGVLRALGQDLGVPGAAQGASAGGRRGARATSTSR